MVRVLGLGNDILSDDAFGFRVARQVGTVFPPTEVEAVSSSLSGLHLLDYLLDTDRLVVVDTVQTGRATPGTLYVLHERDLPAPAAAAPHGMALLEALTLARRLNLSAAPQVVVIAVEAADCQTIGGPMHPAVEAAIPRAVAAAAELIDPRSIRVRPVGRE